MAILFSVLLAVCLLSLLRLPATNSAAVDTRITNSKFKPPLEDQIINSKFENPTVFDGLNFNIDFQNSKFKNPYEDDEDEPIFNSKFENPLFFNTGGEDKGDETRLESKLTNPPKLDPNLDKDEDYDEVKEDVKKVRKSVDENRNSKSLLIPDPQTPTSPFVFLFNSKTGKALNGQSGAFAYFNKGVLRPLFSIGESFSGGLSQLSKYYARPFPALHGSGGGFLNFFGTTADSDYPFAYRSAIGSREKPAAKA